MENYFNLTEKDYLSLKEKAIERTAPRTPFTYYINNCEACIDSYKDVGSIVSDLIYRTEEEFKDFNYDIDIVGYYVNEIYYSKANMNKKAFISNLVSRLVIIERQAKIAKGLYNKYL